VPAERMIHEPDIQRGNRIAFDENECMRLLKPLLVLSVCIAAACSSTSQPQNSAPMQAVSYDPAALPSGTLGTQIRYGHDLITDTQKYLRSNVRAQMSCAACHVGAGTKPRGGSFVGIYAQFPQYNKRSNRIITLQDRLAECFLYSMNGHPPAYQSREMIAMVSYIAYLSRGTKVGATPDPSVRLSRFEPPQKADAKRGAAIYAQHCQSCHMANGNGVAGSFPPLWGAKSFNDGAGMHRLWTMAAFVRYNMPQNAPGSLSDQQAYDVSAYVLSHSRPHFNRNRLVEFAPDKASYF
jgi:thiosulfate dehydrogenase